MIRSRKRKALAEKLRAKSSSDDKKLVSSNDGSSDDPLHKTGRLWGGMINDIKRRFPMYRSDIVDGMNSETFAATLFLYFAGLATGEGDFSFEFMMNVKKLILKLKLTGKIKLEIFIF
jgi:hypothetical protein